MPSRLPPVLLLDVMGTLVHDPFYAEIPAFLGMSFDELLASKDPHAWVDFELGRTDEATMVARFFRDRRPVDGVGLRECVRRSYAWLDGMEQLCADLHDSGVEMHALSNYSPWYGLVEDALGLSRFVPWSFVSCDMRVRKPHPDAFRIPLARLGRQPADAILVDDRAANCEAADALGIDTIRFEGSAALGEALRARGVLGSGR